MTKKINIIVKGKDYINRSKNITNISSIACPMDQKCIAVLEKLNIGNIFNSIVDKQVQFLFGQVLAEGLSIDRLNYPNISSIIDDVSRNLGIKRPYSVIVDGSGINASTTGSDKNPFIMVTEKLIRYLDESELKFVFAHECGHIVIGHMLYHNIVSYANLLANTVFQFPGINELYSLLSSGWSRSSEITADRIGLLCCQNLRDAQYALLKSSGFRTIKNIDIDNYIQQSKNTLQRMMGGYVGQLLNTHPLTHVRLEALDLFYNSELYYKTIGKTIPENKILLSKDELNNRTQTLLRLI